MTTGVLESWRNCHSFNNLALDLMIIAPLYGNRISSAILLQNMYLFSIENKISICNVSEKFAVLFLCTAANLTRENKRLNFCITVLKIKNLIYWIDSIGVRTVLEIMFFFFLSSYMLKYPLLPLLTIKVE